MPMTVITLQNSTPSLRGDLTKWMQEIDTGVYVGNFNSKIREQLWSRVKQSIGNGRATMSYYSRNELGYRVETYQTNREIVDYDGVQLVSLPAAKRGVEILKGFSRASKLRKARVFSTVQNKPSINKALGNYVVLDLETDGLDKNTNNIIEIGVVKVEYSNITFMSDLISTGHKIPSRITKLTGITMDMLNSSGVSIDLALENLIEFIGDKVIVGYNIDFDIGFINNELKKIGKEKLMNRTYDLLRFVKKEKMFLPNYKLQTVLNEYKVSKMVPHRALEDAKIINELAGKVNGFLDFVKSKH